MNTPEASNSSKRYGDTFQPTRALAMRRAQLGVTITSLGKASGMSKQHLAQVISERRPVSLPMIRRMAMLLHCPPELLISEDPTGVIGFPTPPAAWLDVIEANRGTLGFNDITRVPAWSFYEALLHETLSQQNTK
jgi:transcriptional regulator with XRE-family HTH domain